MLLKTVLQVKGEVHNFIIFLASTATGTTVKFEPPTGTDTMIRNGTNQTINTKHMCVVAMKQYEGKSIEVGWALIFFLKFTFCIWLFKKCDFLLLTYSLSIKIP